MMKRRKAPTKIIPWRKKAAVESRERCGMKGNSRIDFNIWLVP
jgi:hypothetical protein